jgi:hypothetical protein
VADPRSYPSPGRPFPYANGEPAHRVVLGAWHSEGSMVKVTPEGVELIAFPFNPHLHIIHFFEQYRQIVSILINPWSAYYLSHQGNTPYPDKTLKEYDHEIHQNFRCSCRSL